MRRYQKENGVSDGVSAETIGQLESILRFDGGAHRGLRKIVLETKIYTRQAKRAVGKEYNWKSVEGGMNVIEPKTLKRARTAIETICEIDPVGDMVEDMKSQVFRSAQRRVAKHHAGFDALTEQYEEN